MTGGAWGGNYQARPDLTRAQKANWLRLIRSENVGPITFRDLLNFCGSAEAAIERLPELMAKSRGKRRINLADPADIDREMDTLEARGWRLIARGENAYPSALQHIAGAPPLISVAGDVAALMKPCVAIVGSRNASANGQKITNMLGRDLVDAGYAITSGFARGIDTAAHRAALKPGGTVAVFAGGLDVIYPPENRDLFAAMIENGGCAITEMPLGWKPRAQDFPRRNRIVAGMSLGTVVVEANPRSGSLITARLANELGRIVFAVPGSPLDPRAKGANKLLSEGATIVTEANDIISLLAPLVDNVSDEKAGGELFEADPNESPLLQSLIGEEAALDLQASPPNNQEIATDARDAPISAREKVLTLLSASPTEIDEIIRQCSLTQSALKATLVDLELEGLIEQKGGFVTRLC